MNITVNFNLPDNNFDYNLFIQSKNMFDFVSDFVETTRAANKIDEPLTKTELANLFERASDILFEIDNNT